MNLQGDFEGLTLAGILQLLCNEQKTGILTVKRNNEESRVFFDQGTIVYATASLKQARLGFLLRTDGIISAQQLQKCLADARESKVHIGKVLVEKGYISLETLKKYNTRQVEAVLYDLLFWEKGRFDYRDARLNLKSMIVTQLNPMKLILEASRRIDELSVLKKVIPSDRLVFKMSGKVKSKEEIKLNANEWRVLSLIDGSRSVRQVIQESGYDEFAVYKIFFSVISSGLIEQKEHAPAEDPDDLTTVFTVFSDIVQSIRANISQELGDRADSLFEESLLDLEAPAKNLFSNFHPKAPADANLKAVEAALKGMDDVKSKKTFFIQGSCDYCTKVLIRVGDILGNRPLSAILEDIEKILAYVRKYQAESNEKDPIVSQMNTVLSDIRSRFGTDPRPPKKGLFSLFS